MKNFFGKLKGKRDDLNKQGTPMDDLDHTYFEGADLGDDDDDGGYDDDDD